MDIKEYAKENHVPIILDEGLEFLLQYIKNHNIKNILELGTAIGYSSTKMAKLSEDIQIDTIEINQEMYDQAIKNISNENLQDRIHVYLMDALEFETDKKYDLVFVDAAKGKYKKYLEKFSKNASLFLFDNLEFHGMVDHPEMTNNRNTKSLLKKIRNFRDSILLDDKYECTYHKTVGDGILVLKVK